MKQAQREGIPAVGPYPADTIFLRAKRGEFHGVVIMYHDQGQIATKLLGFDHGVTVQGGLSVVIAVRECLETARRRRTLGEVKPS